MNTFLLKGGALVLALTLGGGYVLYRSTSNEVFDQTLPGSKSPAGGWSANRPAAEDDVGPVLFPGSKSAPIAPLDVEYSERPGYPASEDYPAPEGYPSPTSLPQQGTASGKPSAPGLLPGSKSMILVPSEPPTPNRQPAPRAPAQQAVQR